MEPRARMSGRMVGVDAIDACMFDGFVSVVTSDCSTSTGELDVFMSLEKRQSPLSFNSTWYSRRISLQQNDRLLLRR